MHCMYAFSVSYYIVHFHTKKVNTYDYDSSVASFELGISNDRVATEIEV